MAGESIYAERMKILLAFLLFVGAAGLFSYEYFNGRYWLMSPPERVDMKWSYEIAKITAKDRKLATALQLLKDFKITTSDPQFKYLIDESHPPFRKSTKGVYLLDIHINPWMEERKYGYMITHQLIDASGNTLTEFTININIGYLW